jgi:hypothetical protein
MVVGGSDLPASSLPIVSLIGARHGGEFNISNDAANQALNTENWGTVSCTSPNAREAIVGDTTLVALADRVWSTEPQYPAHMTLMNVSCASSTCVAIGRYHQQAASITPVLEVRAPIKLFQTRPAATHPDSRPQSLTLRTPLGATG